MTKLLLITLICLLLVGCGSKGDLYLPADKSDHKLPTEQSQSDNKTERESLAFPPQSHPEREKPTS